LLLKQARLSAVDLDDCLRLLAHTATAGEAIDVARAVAALDALPATTDAGLASRRSTLRAALMG
jgi:hypothetical protein